MPGNSYFPIAPLEVKSRKPRGCYDRYDMGSVVGLLKLLLSLISSGIVLNRLVSSIIFVGKQFYFMFYKFVEILFIVSTKGTGGGRAILSYEELSDSKESLELFLLGTAAIFGKPI